MTSVNKNGPTNSIETQDETMPRKKLAEVKLALAQKYDRLAKAASSKVKKKTFIHKAEAYRRQVKQISR